MTGFLPSRYSQAIPRYGSAVRHLRAVAHLLSRSCADQIEAVARVLAAVRDQDLAVYTFGNGGSAATALHLANDLSAATCRGRTRLRVECLVGNPSILSAIANDLGYEQVFARQLEHKLAFGDAVLGISASGNSRNCVTALELARQRGAVTVGFLGFDGGAMYKLCDHVIHVPATDYMVIEDVHLCFSHALTCALDEF